MSAGAVARGRAEGTMGSPMCAPRTSSVGRGRTVRGGIVSGAHSRTHDSAEAEVGLRVVGHGRQGPRLRGRRTDLSTPWDAVTRAEAGAAGPLPPCGLAGDHGGTQRTCEHSPVRRTPRAHGSRTISGRGVSVPERAGRRREEAEPVAEWPAPPQDGVDGSTGAGPERTRVGPAPHAPCHGAGSGTRVGHTGSTHRLRAISLCGAREGTSPP